MKARIILLLVITAMMFACSEDSNEPNLPATPGNLLLTQVDAHSIYLSWQDNSNNETGFRIDRKIGSNGWEQQHLLPGEDATGCLDDSLEVYEEYQYRICSYNEDEQSSFETAAIYFADIDSLAAPTELIVEQLDANTIQLNWMDNSTAEEGYRIDRKIGDGEWQENYQILSANSDYFCDTDLQEIATYYYRVKAFIGSAYSSFAEAECDFSFDDVFSIEPLFIGQIDITPYESFDMVVELKDINGEIVQRNYEVWYKILASPEGMNINNQAFGTGDSVSVQSEEGLAVATLNAGLNSGSAVVEVFTFDMQNNRISMIRSNIVVHASVPEFIDITYGGIDSGVNVGGGNWQIEVAAFITDSFGNPADFGTAVWFSLEDPTNSAADPTWAVIDNEAYVGNVNANGDSLAGVAYTKLVYDGAYTNEELIIRAEVSSFSGIISQYITAALPLQFGQIYVQAIPAHLDWQNSTLPYTNDEDSLSTVIRVEVMDGQNNMINGQQVHFNSDLGFPVPSQPGANPFFGWTGDEPGVNNKIYYFQKIECAPPIPAPPGATVSPVEVTISGTNISDQTSVLLYRYVD